jgi:hypothetical protein
MQGLCQDWILGVNSVSESRMAKHNELQKLCAKVYVIGKEYKTSNNTEGEVLRKDTRVYSHSETSQHLVI